MEHARNLKNVNAAEWTMNIWNVVQLGNGLFYIWEKCEIVTYEVIICLNGPGDDSSGLSFCIPMGSVCRNQEKVSKTFRVTQIHFMF